MSLFTKPYAKNQLVDTRVTEWQIHVRRETDIKVPNWMYNTSQHKGQHSYSNSTKLSSHCSYMTYRTIIIQSIIHHQIRLWARAATCKVRDKLWLMDKRESTGVVVFVPGLSHSVWDYISQSSFAIHEDKKQSFHHNQHVRVVFRSCK